MKALIYPDLAGNTIPDPALDSKKTTSSQLFYSRQLVFPVSENAPSQNLKVTIWTVLTRLKKPISMENIQCR
jgi:hypothetical protein